MVDRHNGIDEDPFGAFVYFEDYDSELKAKEILATMLHKIADGLNTPWPFPTERTEHDTILVESAVSAGKALQTIGTNILNEDWGQYEDIPPLVKALKAKLHRLVEAAQLLVDHSKDLNQQEWASLPDVLELKAAIEAVKES